MISMVSPASRRRARSVAIATLASSLLCLGALHDSLNAQQSDTTRADSSRAHRLETVTVSALRGPSDAPISKTTLTQADIKPRYFGQDVPLLLQGIAPSLTSYDETGNYWGYSYIRLRGIDQSRINLTLDGIPLNDPEDQVLYFADFPDLASSLNSVQVQRGVGTSSNGTAAYAGSINMETIPIAATPAGGVVNVDGGSFGSYRVNGSYATGLLSNHLAAYARVSDIHTDGYRYHSGVNGRSLFASAGYFGDANILKATVTTGTMKDTMAYDAVALSDLDTNRRINPLTPQERDGFGERIASLAYTHLFGPSSSLATTVYRISADGDYDVQLDSLEQFNLNFAWYGITSDWTYRRDALQVDLGGNANTYARDHFAFMHPDLTDPVYFNTGHKRDASAFAKVAYTLGHATLFGDVQARRAEFSYTPDANAGIAPLEIDWSFLNPKAGVTYDFNSRWSAYASYGKNSREPARQDMFAGFDNIDTSNVAFIGGLNRVKPETVHDVEIGTGYHGSTFAIGANLYSMDFRNEIQPIGVLTYQGNPLRENVDASYRRGIEAMASWAPVSRLTLSGNAMASVNRIRHYVDATGDSAITFNNVEPLLTPRFQSFLRAQVAATRRLAVSLEGRYQSRAFLENTSDPNFVLPASFELTGSAIWTLARYQVIVRGNNLLNTLKYGSGYASGGVSYFYVVPPRNVFVGVGVGF